VPGNLSLANCKGFLEKGHYTEDEQNAGSGIVSGGSGAPMVEIKRRIAGKEVTFDVYDSVTHFSSSRWRRVVAVFVNGQDWQFRDWKNGDLKRELFARVRGYYMGFVGAKSPPQVHQWNLMKLELPRYKRHHDVNVQNQFWFDFEQFLKRERFKGCDF